jgi:hypothetical protein
MQDNCPDIRIPHLFGFGFSDDRHVSPPRCRGFHHLLTMLTQFEHLVYSCSASTFLHPLCAHG